MSAAQQGAICELYKVIETYLEPEQTEQVIEAYQFSSHAHRGQHRASGESYITHPVEVAKILANMCMDQETLSAALLHDTIEDTPTIKQEIKKKFGVGVAQLVDGVSKLDRIKFDSEEDAQAHNFRKMLMAMTNDIRVILIKLADRLHNMRTLHALKPNKKLRIARETLEIYAPIALRIGMDSIRQELEELGFAHLYPVRYKVLGAQINKRREHREKAIKRIKEEIETSIQQENIDGEILWREKHRYSIYQKMRNQKRSFKEIYDVYAFRIIVKEVSDCYRVLGAVHNLYKPVPGKFKDCIAIPKANGYQSLHTILSALGLEVEIQIRTQEMNKVAEIGVAAHWSYKAGQPKNIAQHRAISWINNIMELQKTISDPKEFLEQVKIDLFPDNIYVFTPKGEILELPRSATAVDFAYAIHTGVGDRCVGVKIENKTMPLSTLLQNGQKVEILTARGSRPDPAWLNFVASARAYSNIRHYLKNLKHTRAIELGRGFLYRELEAYNIDYETIDKTTRMTILKNHNSETEEELFKQIGLGDLIAPLIAKQIVMTINKKDSSNTTKKTKKAIASPLVIKDTEGMVVHFAKCCYPIPGDSICGMMTVGQGIVIHRQSCTNLLLNKNHPRDSWITVKWSNQTRAKFKSMIKTYVSNIPGALATIAAAIADTEVNIDNLEFEEFKERDNRYFTIYFLLEVTHRKHLAEVIRKIRIVKPITQVKRL